MILVAVCTTILLSVKAFLVVNVSVQNNNGGFLPDIIMLTQQCYYHMETRLNTIKRFCFSSL